MDSIGEAEVWTGDPEDREGIRHWLLGLDEPDPWAPLLERITLTPRVLCGKPCIRGTRISVELVMECLGSGQTFAELLHSYPGLVSDDLRACAVYAGRAADAQWRFGPDGPGRH